MSPPLEPEKKRRIGFATIDFLYRIAFIFFADLTHSGLLTLARKSNFTTQSLYSGSGSFRVSGKKGSARKPTRKQEHIMTPA